MGGRGQGQSCPRSLDRRAPSLSVRFSSTVKNWSKATRIPLLASRTRRLAKAMMITTTTAETMTTLPLLPPTAARQKRRSQNHRAHRRRRHRASQSRSSLARHPSSIRAHKRRRSSSIPFKVISPLPHPPCEMTCFIFYSIL